MIKHEQKICPRCQAIFECKVGSITLCQCTTVQTTEQQREHLRKRYPDCLCANCIRELTSAISIL